MGSTTEPTQLYNLLNNLRYHITHDGDLATILGYSVLDSLMKFKTNTGSAEEREFEEIKTIYSGLENLTQKLRSDSPFGVRCSYIKSVSEYLAHSDKEEYSSNLLQEITTATQGSRRSNEDQINRFGLAIMAQSERKGPFTGTKNCLTQDYQTVRQAIKSR